MENRGRLSNDADNKAAKDNNIF